jgi:hypothetical protein
MNHRFTLSIFTMEINGTPTVALQAKRHKEAESLCEQDWSRTDSLKGVVLRVLVAFG